MYEACGSSWATVALGVVSAILFFVSLIALMDANRSRRRLEAARDLNRSMRGEIQRLRVVATWVPIERKRFK